MAEYEEREDMLAAERDRADKAEEMLHAQRADNAELVNQFLTIRTERDTLSNENAAMKEHIVNLEELLEARDYDRDDDRESALAQSVQQ
jgi:septal ring factor EnvC (AmiA/AmiB activator)